MSTSLVMKFPLWAAIAIAIPMAMLAAVLALIVIFVYCLRLRTQVTGVQRREERPEVAIDMTGTSEPLDDQENLVLFESSYNFDIHDLLRSEAKLLGQDWLGTAYKANLKGVMVFIRVLKHVEVSKEVFESQMKLIGRIKRHQNLAHLNAFYHSTVEKFLVYDYYPAARSLTTLMDVKYSGSFDWHTRARIVHGIARGIAHIHRSTGDSTFTHGNIIPSNVLIDQDGEARLINTGLLPVMEPPPTPSFLSDGYRAPEVFESGEHTPKSDVYSFGILLLEMLTGKQRILKQDIQAWIIHSMKNVNGTDCVGTHKVPGAMAQAVLDMGFNVDKMKFNNVPDVTVHFLINVGLECSALDPDNRPAMTEVLSRFDQLFQPVEPEKGENLLAASSSSQTDRYAKAKIEDPTQLLPSGELYYRKFFGSEVASGVETVTKVYRIRNKDLFEILGENFEDMKQIHIVTKARIALLANDESESQSQSYIDLVGTVDQVRAAEELILDNALKKYDSPVYPVILMPPTIHWEQVTMSLYEVVRFIGPNCRNPIKLENETGTWIMINDGPTGGSALDRIVSVYGPREHVIKALSLIQSAIHTPGESSKAEKEIDELFKKLQCGENSDETSEPEKQKQQKSSSSAEAAEK